MVKIGNYNRLTIVRRVDFGLYLDSGNGDEILLPKRYVRDDFEIGETIEVFVYKDSENRLIATTAHPHATVGEFAYMTVVDTNKVGAFLDWGIMKDILVPFKEQLSEMKKEGVYLVYVYLDDATKRVVASAKISKFIGNLIPDYRRGDVVDTLVIEEREQGYRTIVDNRFYGMIYKSDLFRPLHVRDRLKALVKGVRPDGKIDLYPGEASRDRTEEISNKIFVYLQLRGGCARIGDKSSPEEIRRLFACSKKDFKKALGHLYRQHIINISEDSLSLVDKI